MFKHGNKGEEKEKDIKEKEKDKKDLSKEERKKEKERQKSEKKAEREEKKAERDDRKGDDRKRAITANPLKSSPKDIPERSLSSPGFSESPSNRPSSPVVSPRQTARATVNIDQLALDKDDVATDRRNSADSHHTVLPASSSSSPIPAQALSLPHSTSHSMAQATPPPSQSHPLSMSTNLQASGGIPIIKSVEKHNEKQHEQVSLLKTKIGTLPPETKQLVECLLNIFSRTLPDKWVAPPSMDAIALDDQIDITVDKLVEASEILFNKDAPSLLKKYAKDLRESPNRRTDKWKIMANMLGSNDDKQFKTLFLTTDALDSVIISALAQPLEADESEILADVLKLSIIHDIALKELLAVVQSASKSNAHVKNKLDENKSLSDAIVELVCSFRKLARSAEEEVQVQDLKKDQDVSDSLNQSVALLEHANMIKHAKGGNDVIHPLESFFQEQILEEIREGEKWQKTSEEAKEEKIAKLREIDDFIADEEGKLKNVQATITDLEAKLEQKKAEEKILQVSLALKLKEREQYVKEREQTETEIKSHIDETAQHLEHHKKAEESVTKFSQDITSILDKEVSETLKKTRDVLHELEKEVKFLEEKMVTYERSMSLFNNEDEPAVLDGLRKLFSRSTAIYAESKLSVSRVSGVVELLRTVLGEDSSSVEELAASLEKIVSRQNALNQKYKLQKE